MSGLFDKLESFWRGMGDPTNNNFDYYLPSAKARTLQRELRKKRLQSQSSLETPAKSVRRDDTLFYRRYSQSTHSINKLIRENRTQMQSTQDVSDKNAVYVQTCARVREISESNSSYNNCGTKKPATGLAVHRRGR